MSEMIARLNETVFVALFQFDVCHVIYDQEQKIFSFWAYDRDYGEASLEIETWFNLNTGCEVISLSGELFGNQVFEIFMPDGNSYNPLTHDIDDDLFDEYDEWLLANHSDLV